MKIIHYHHRTLSSTNDWCKAHREEWPALGTLLIVTCDEQTNGRGQFGRQWIAPYGQNLTASFCFKASLPCDVPMFTQIMALSLIDVLADFGLTGIIKPPNDILLNGKKIAGILCETFHDKKRIGVIIGVGLNVNMPEEQLKKIDQPATSLSLELGYTLKIGEVLNQLKAKFLQHLSGSIEL